MTTVAAHSATGQFIRISRVLRFVWPFTRGRAILSLILLLAAGVTEGVSILLIIPVLANLIPGATTVDLSLAGLLPNLDGLPRMQIDLLPLLGLLVLAVTIQGALARASTLAIVDTTLSAAHAMRSQLFTSVGYARWQKIMMGRHADITHALTMDVDRVQVVLNSILFIIQSLVMLFLYVALALLASPTMTGAAVLFGGAFLFMLYPLRSYASAYGEKLSLQRQQQYRTIGEFLKGLKIVKSLNAEERYVGAFTINSNSLTEELKALTRVNALPGYLFQVTSAIAVAVFVYVSVRYAALPIAELVVLLFLFMRIAPRFNRIQADYQNLIVNVGGYDNLSAVITTYGQDQESAASSGVSMRLSDHLAFQGVSFRYQAGADPVLSRASFVIPARQVTALIGASGSGKSTVADLIMGLLEPTEGSIQIDGVTLDAATRRGWRECVAYVPQEVFMINDSVRANLAFGKPDAVDLEMWAALDKAQAADIVRRLPNGLDSPVGEDGVQLSGGERQRIALARALLRAPEVLILDEATSALDWQNQALIAEAIQSLRGRMTVVTIAHRPSMIGFADWVVAIENGQVAETGPFAAFADAKDSVLARLLAGETAHDG